MRHVTVVLLLLASVVGATDAVLACGDKFLVPSRGTRFERARPDRQDATVLLYANPGSELARRLMTLAVVDTLRKEGYRPTLTVTPEEFGSMVRQRDWDLVVLDINDLGLMSNRSGAPRIVPVTYTLSGNDLKQAKRQYPLIVKAPDRARTFVDAVDAAVQSRRVNRPASR
jgi:hypothetical protein